MTKEQADKIIALLERIEENTSPSHFAVSIGSVIKGQAQDIALKLRDSLSHEPSIRVDG
jgi:hypothetical protein